MSNIIDTDTINNNHTTAIQLCVYCQQSTHSSTECPDKITSSDTRRQSNKRVRSHTNLDNNNNNIPDGNTIGDIEQRIKLSLLLLSSEHNTGNNNSNSNNNKRTVPGSNNNDSIDITIAKINKSIQHDIIKFNEYFNHTLVQCVLTSSGTISHYATLIGLINTEQSIVIESLLQYINQQIIDTYQYAHYFECRLLLQFVSYLVNVNVLCIDVVLSIINDLFTIHGTMDMKVYSSVHSDWLLYTIFTMIIGLNRALTSEPNVDTWYALQSSIDQLMMTRSPTSILQVLTGDEYNHNQDRIINYWAAIKQLANDNWVCDALPLSYQYFTDTLLQSTRQSYELSLNTTQLNIIQPHPIIPDLILYNNSELDTSSINRLLVHEYINDLLYAYQPVHKTLVRHLLNFNYAFSTTHYVFEVIISNLFVLQRSPRQLVLRIPYLNQITSTLFKYQVSTTPGIFGQCINNLYIRADSLNIECIDRLGIYFATHLANFAFAWPWNNWHAILDDIEIMTQQQILIRTVLIHLVRLSYWERTAHSLPEEFIQLMPHQPAPAFRFAEKNIPQLPGGDIWHTYSTKLIDLVKQHSKAHEVLQWLVDNVSPALGVKASLRLLLPCLLELGNKSFSHIFTLLDQYNDILHSLSESDEYSKQVVIHLVAEYWQHSVQNISVIINKLLILQLTDCDSIIAWVWSGLPNQLYDSRLWQILIQSLYHVLVIQQISDTNETTALQYNEQHADIIVLLLLHYRFILTQSTEPLQQIILKQRLHQVLRTFSGHIRLYSNVIDISVLSDTSPMHDTEEQCTAEQRDSAKQIIQHAVQQAIKL